MPPAVAGVAWVVAVDVVAAACCSDLVHSGFEPAVNAAAVDLELVLAVDPADADHSAAVLGLVVDFAFVGLRVPAGPELELERVDVAVAAVAAAAAAASVVVDSGEVFEVD